MCNFFLPVSVSWFVSRPTPLTTTEEISTNFDGVWVSAQNRPLLTFGTDPDKGPGPGDFLAFLRIVRFIEY